MGLDTKGRMAIRLSVPLPPSDNNLTFLIMVGKGKRQFPKRSLTPEARAFQSAVKQEVAALALKTPLEFRKDVKYTCIVRVFFGQIENSGWPEKAEDRYKQLDATNRIKLVTDSVSEAININDKHHFSTHVYKDENKEDPHIRIVIREEEPRGQEQEVDD
jgi:Holliday junction resolvase RusA-like endonuclease